ncbi:zinc chaperone YciC-like [Clytia hemisphaerica]|uniref:CobW C-terminal domain-containing protein n=1 Tax=Clytia hemisphaerica TaxID=252671 RepID=A0A7M5UFQ3_9CNID
MGLEAGRKNTKNALKSNVSKQEKKQPDPKDLLPVSLLCGFLGAGKTTLLKHILETKHNEEGFRCAVIVNDMATLNIDKSLIDQSALVQSDEVIAMQNGCFCCTLQSDLVDQIVSLASKNIFDYMLIEASGVSEPAQIAPLFDLCEDEHDHEEEHPEGPELGEVARLDTCVTVIDAAEFYNNLESMKMYEDGDMVGTISELLMEQVEYSNVVILNKQDLVNEHQKADIMAKIKLLNPRAKILTTFQSTIDVREILNTNLYSKEAMDEDAVICSATRQGDSEDDIYLPECCVKSVESGKKKCCKSKNAENKQIVDSGKSQLFLGVVDKISGKKQLTRHEKRFGISSFVYRSRRPFHPGRFNELFLEPFFIMRFEEENNELDQLQKRAAEKQKIRTKSIGELLRAKGFLWIASSHEVLGGFQQAGNVVRVEEEGPWMVHPECRDKWEGTDTEERVLKDMTNEKGEEYEYGDRRQELVFIGMTLKYETIQKILDECLLTDDEMKLGPEKWFETMESEDKLKLSLDVSDDEDEDYEDENGEQDDINEGGESDPENDDEKEEPKEMGKVVNNKRKGDDVKEEQRPENKKTKKK